MQNIRLNSGLEAVLQAYDHHCRQVSGLASGTCANRLRWARSFVSDLSAAGPLALAQLSARAVVGYLGKASADCSSQILPSFIGGIRCFLRFLGLQELTPVGLEQVLLAVARPATDPPPKYLSPEQQEQLLDAPDRRTAGGRRDYAILLCLARLGLRAGEIARVRLEDVDWQQGTLWLHQTKGRRARSLPLPADVGQAWVGYLRRGRPPTTLREIFVSSHPIARPMSPGSISNLVSRAVTRAGLSLPSRGAHLFRHTVATPKEAWQNGIDGYPGVPSTGLEQLPDTARWVFASHERPEKVKANGNNAGGITFNIGRMPYYFWGPELEPYQNEILLCRFNFEQPDLLCCQDQDGKRFTLRARVTMANTEPKESQAQIGRDRASWMRQGKILCDGLQHENISTVVRDLNYRPEVHEIGRFHNQETERVRTEQNETASATTRARRKAAAAGFDPSRLRIKNPKRVAAAAERIADRFAALRQKEAEEIESQGAQ